jgi:large subunit ribosomal protein L5
MADEKEVKAKPAKQAKAPKKSEAAERPTGKVAKLREGYVPRLRQHYDDVVRAKLTEQFGYKNVMEVPKITKIVLNMGVGEATQDSKLVQVAASELEKIAGQKVVITKSKKAIAQFKIRENLAIGAKVTCARCGCMSSLTGSSPSPCRGCATSADFRKRALMAVATMPWASRNT